MKIRKIHTVVLGSGAADSALLFDLTQRASTTWQLLLKGWIKALQSTLAATSRRITNLDFAAPRQILLARWQRRTCLREAQTAILLLWKRLRRRALSFIWSTLAFHFPATLLGSMQDIKRITTPLKERRAADLIRLVRCAERLFARLSDEISRSMKARRCRCLPWIWKQRRRTTKKDYWFYFDSAGWRADSLSC